MTDPEGYARRLPRYDIRRSYAWNYEHPPEPVAVDVVDVPGEWHFCGLPVDSPLGMPAGPLLNGDWCLYYAALGFDVLTYKTVRSRRHPCYPLPNLEPVEAGMLQGGETDVPSSRKWTGSWAVSFGMPSQPPEVWRDDVERTRKRLPAGKRLSVSVVATVQQGWGLDELADDYARCAGWAVESGADCVETNFSCPNVSSCDGQLYQQAEQAGVVAARVREAVGDTPLLIKIGHLPERSAAEALVRALSPHADALATTNSVAATVRGLDGQLLFGGQPRGICGAACRTASLAQTRLLRDLIQRCGSGLQLVGVGGVESAEHVVAYLEAGAHAVQIATAAMADPRVAVRIRRQLAGGGAAAEKNSPASNSASRRPP